MPPREKRLRIRDQSRDSVGSGKRSSSVFSDKQHSAAPDLDCHFCRLKSGYGQFINQEPFRLPHGDESRISTGTDSWRRTQTRTVFDLLCSAVTNLDWAGALQFARRAPCDAGQVVIAALLFSAVLQRGQSKWATIENFETLAILARSHRSNFRVGSWRCFRNVWLGGDRLAKG